MLSDNSLHNMMIQPKTNNHLAFGPSTTVEESLQINSFMQNEPNFRKSQMNVNKVLTKDYEKKSNWTLGENEPKTNPIKANTKPIKANKMPKQTQYKAKQSQFQRQKMLLRMKINPRRKSFGHYADEIEAAFNRLWRQVSIDKAGIFL